MLTLNDTRCYYFDDDIHQHLLIISPTETSLDLMGWLNFNLSELKFYLQHHGAILLRGFQLYSAQLCQKTAETLIPHLLPYLNRSTPRTHIGGKIYTSTEYPPEQIIPQHNENSYSHEWPEEILFFCLVPPTIGGETPITDSRLIYQHMPHPLKKKFLEAGVLYLRNYRHAMGLSWQDAFQTSNPSEVDTYLKKAGIEWVWHHNEHLTTKYKGPAAILHKMTNQHCWFNQAHLFHIYSLCETYRNYLLNTYTSEEMPRHAYFGDQTEIEPDDITQILALYQEHSYHFAWQRGDILWLDNQLYAHGRFAFTGNRKIVVAMGNN